MSDGRTDSRTRDADLLLSEVDSLESTREAALRWAEALQRELLLDGNGPAQEAMENLLTVLTEREAGCSGTSRAVISAQYRPNQRQETD